LNGFGTELSTKLEDWESFFPQYEQLLLWLIANKQNKFQWYFLWGQKWNMFADSLDRNERLKKMVHKAHEFGIIVGFITPFGKKKINKNSNDTTTLLEIN
jgi:hypothetical protein